MSFVESAGSDDMQVHLTQGTANRALGSRRLFTGCMGSEKVQGKKENCYHYSSMERAWSTKYTTHSAKPQAQETLRFSKILT